MAHCLVACSHEMESDMIDECYQRYLNCLESECGNVVFMPEQFYLALKKQLREWLCKIYITILVFMFAWSVSKSQRGFLPSLDLTRLILYRWLYKLIQSTPGNIVPYMLSWFRVISYDLLILYVLQQWCSTLTVESCLFLHVY